LPQAAERITVRSTRAGSRPCATVAAATLCASTDVPFATSDAPGTDVTTTADAVVVSARATTAVARAIKEQRKEIEGTASDVIFLIKNVVLTLFNV